jgi:hypothetical protein
MKKVLAGLALVVLLGAGCKSTQTSPVPTDFSMTLSHGSCYASCPTYSIYVQADGKGVYDGTAFVETVGKKDFVISQQEVADLNNRVNEIKFFTLENSYYGTAFGPIEDPTSDYHTNAISITSAGRSKTITFDIPPAELDRLVRLVDTIVKPERFVSVDSAICQEKYLSVKNELDSCMGSLQQNSAFQKKIEEYRQREGIWKKIASFSSQNMRRIGLSLMASTSTSVYNLDQVGSFFVVEQRKNPSHALTLVTFGQSYPPQTNKILRGFYVVDNKGEMKGSFVVREPWEHFSLGNVGWKDDKTIEYDTVLASEGGPVPPEQGLLIIE